MRTYERPTLKAVGSFKNETGQPRRFKRTSFPDFLANHHVFGRFPF